MNRRRDPALACAFIVWAAFASAIAEPKSVFLTWSQADTARTISVRYRSSSANQKPSIHYDTESRRGERAKYAHTSIGVSRSASGLNSAVYYFDLEDLKPKTAYYFVIGSERDGYSKELKFRTLPHDESSLRFIVGGDMGISKSTRHMLAQAAKLSPDFAVIGGDIAYDNGRSSNEKKWKTWAENWSSIMITTDGYLIPLAAAIGNHEVRGGFLSGVSESQTREKAAPNYFTYLEQDADQSYFVRKFGSLLKFFFLDSGHISALDGEQAGWLDDELGKATDAAYRIPIYHVPLYPSVRDFDNRHSTATRKVWEPIFNRHGLAVAFENHDHALKRTKPMKDGKVASDGVVYLGDGAMGVDPRRVHPDRFYLETAKSARNFWLVDITQHALTAKAIGENGEILDRWPLTHEKSEHAKK